MIIVRFVFDSLLGVMYVIPAILLGILGLFCNGWNVGTGWGTCSSAALEPIYNGIYNALLTPTLPSLLIGATYMIAISVILLGAVGFRLMSLSEGLTAVRRDWFGFLVLSLAIFLFAASI